MNIEKQSVKYMAEATSRNREPIRTTTTRVYDSYLRNWIVPLIGKCDIAKFDNGDMRNFVKVLVSAKMSASTISGIVNCVKEIIASDRHKDGRQKVQIIWDTTWIDAPIVKKKDQDAPTIGREALQKALGDAQPRFKPLYALLAGSGLRIAEGVALQVGKDDGIGSFWIPEQSKLVIRGQMQNGKFVPCKTEAGNREVDLAPELNAILPNKPGFMFLNDSGKPFGTTDSALKRKADAAGIPGFHSLRRFRITHLDNASVPSGLVKFWCGHAGANVTDRYIKSGEDIKARKEWAAKAGLGFSL